MTYMPSDILCLEIKQHLIFTRQVAILKNGLKQTDPMTSLVK